MNGKSYKRSLIIISIILVVGFVALFAGILHNKKVQAAYNTRIERVVSGIKNQAKGAKKLDDKQKLAEIKKLRGELDRYKSGSEKDTSIIVAYSDSIDSLGKGLRDKNEVAFTKLVVKDLTKEGRDSLNAKITELKKLQKVVDGQQGLLYTEDEAAEFDAKVQKQIKVYTAQVKAIEKDIAAANAAATTAAANAQAQSDTTDTTGSSDTGYGDYNNYGTSNSGYGTGTNAGTGTGTGTGSNTDTGNTDDTTGQ